MNIKFTPQSWEDYLYWQKTDQKILKRINLMIQNIQRTPFEGAGKPEPLKHNLSGYWSRRITEEHRMVYKVFDEDIIVVQVRYHY